MIRPGGFRGAAFGTAEDGNGRDDLESRHRMSAELGVSKAWAWVKQVHGTTVAEVDRPGPGGEADAIVTSSAGLPITIATADCVPVVLEGPEVAAVVHAGWRGAAGGILEVMLGYLEARGTPAERAAIGPSIGPCCYEVGPEVADLFPEHTTQTVTGELSIDLGAAVEAKLAHLAVWRSGQCTFDSSGLYSFRRDKTAQRQVAVAWVPTVTAA